MDFFKLFPTVNYRFQNANGEYLLSVVNPTVHVRIVERLKQSITVLHDYQIQDDERPDTVSVNLYGTPDYTWILLVINNIFTLFDWPLTNDEFLNFLIEKYGSLNTAQSTFLYRTVDGFYVDQATWTALPAAQQGLPQSQYDFELNINDAKRRIRVVPPAFVGPLSLELKKVLAS